MLEDITDPLVMVESALTMLSALRAETGMTKVDVVGVEREEAKKDKAEEDGEEEDGEGGVAHPEKGEKMVMTPPPTISMCSALEACFTGHVDALGEEEEGALTLEESVNNFFLIRASYHTLIPSRKVSCLKSALSQSIQILRGLGGADAS